MLRMTQISEQLRERGRMFGQSTFKADLDKITPVFKEGSVIFYPDNTADLLEANYRMRKQPITPVAVEEPEPTRLERIEASIAAMELMLRDIYNQLTDKGIEETPVRVEGYPWHKKAA